MEQTPEKLLEFEMEKLAEIMAKEAEIAEPFVSEEMNLAENLAFESLLIAEDQALEQQTTLEQTEQKAAEMTAESAEAAAQALAEEVPQLQFELVVQMDQEEIQSCIEALLFISDKPLSTQRLRDLLGPNYDLSLFKDALASLLARYQAVHHGIELIEVSGGFQFRTKPGRADLAQKLAHVQTQKLSTGAMETLAIIAYKQPLMKEEVDKIRGVDSSYFVRNLLNRKLIKISGRSELPGRPILYTTTSEFLEIFGLKDLSSLPSLRELEQMIPHSQSKNPEDEDPKIKEMRRMVKEMKSDRESDLHYNPKEDEKILKEMREKVAAIPTSTPYLDELRAAELAALQPAPLAAPATPPTLNPEQPSESDASVSAPPAI